MKARVFLFFFLFAGSLAAQQTTSVVITDSSGNQTTGTISNGNVYFHDSQGNIAYGTIKNGNVFLSSGKGDITFGTMKNGSVFLSDQNGITTGTIKNGNIFLSNSDGSITTGTYDSQGQVITSTTPSLQQQQQEQEQQREKQQQDYEAGAAIGRSIGSGIATAIENHRENSFCKSNPTSTIHLSDGLNIECPNAPLSSWEQSQIDAYCGDHPGLWIEFGRHRVDCLTPPDPPNLKWATWELTTWQWDFRHQSKLTVPMSEDTLRTQWTYWKGIYCNLALPSATYKDLDGKKHHYS